MTKPNVGLLGTAIEERLKIKDWSKDRLAKEANISPNTLNKIFRPSGKKFRLRGDVVRRMSIKLGCTLDQARQWWEWAGHEQSSFDDATFLVEKDQEGGSSLTPTQYMSELIAKAQDNYQILMIACMVSKPATLEDAEFRSKTIEAINTGKLYMAICCPYTQVDAYLQKPNLVGFYRTISNWANQVAGILRNSVKPEFSGHVRVFYPKKLDLVLIPPVVRDGTDRPCLMKLVKEVAAGTSVEEFHLGSYRRPEKRWILAYKSDGMGDAGAAELCECWKEYFQDILKSWQPLESEKWANLEDSEDWKT